MPITDEKLQAGVKKAVESGILPRVGIPPDNSMDKDLMLEILDAAISVNEEERADAPLQSGYSASKDGLQKSPPY
ncbi:hypothetical protein Q8A64_08425 [Oxalobacteraceae bacterium R-40]|uniref:Uncharacterized protein n=1 Tax=Keguizhuia sedimenti TaxID=3064264 RepID=A0ABU1BN62_9BURK|nr:hypothetical protein [Oxalobacteraceae bacterium R-40]